jgi:flagellar biosynthetic protein FliS
MLAQRSPHEAYRRVDFDARVKGATPAELVHLCYEHLVSALGTALHADRIGDNSLKSRSMTRALTAITALQLGVSGDSDVAAALKHLYESARRTLLDCAIVFDAQSVETLRTDFADIGRALREG